MTLTLAAWLHDLSPVIYKFTDAFAIRWYGLAYAIGFLVGWLWLRSMSRRGMTPLSVQRISDAMLILVMGVVLGGRLGYVVFYDPALITEFTSQLPFWGVLRVNQGGMSSHGGIIGVIVASYVVSRGFKDEHGVRQQKVPWLHVLDITSVACTPGLGLGRIANFINGELLGDIATMPGKIGPWWTVQFPQERATDNPLAALEHAPALNPDQMFQLQNLLDHARVGEESDASAYQRVLHTLQSGSHQASREVAEQLSPLLSSRYPSQLMQAATDGIILSLALWLIWWKPRRPGVVGSWFMVLYGVMRIATEMVRLPDPALEQFKHDWGLSMGQWLSVGMIVVGVVTLIVLKMRPLAWPYPGWGRAEPAKI